MKLSKSSFSLCYLCVSGIAEQKYRSFRSWLPLGSMNGWQLSVTAESLLLLYFSQDAVFQSFVPSSFEGFFFPSDFMKSVLHSSVCGTNACHPSLQGHIPCACIYCEWHAICNHGLFSMILEMCFELLGRVLFLGFGLVLYKTNGAWFWVVSFLFFPIGIS